MAQREGWWERETGKGERVSGAALKCPAEEGWLQGCCCQQWLGMAGSEALTHWLIRRLRRAATSSRPGWSSRMIPFGETVMVLAHLPHCHRMLIGSACSWTHSRFKEIALLCDIIVSSTVVPAHWSLGTADWESWWSWVCSWWYLIR